LFKRVPEGWVFMAPNPWLMGRRPTYLVSEAQRADLGQRVRLGRRCRLAVAVPMLAVMLGLAAMLPTLVYPVSAATWVFFVVATGLLIVAVNLADWIAISPGLAGVPRTSARIGLIEMHGRQAQAMSVKALTIVTLVNALAAAMFVVQWLISPVVTAFSAVAAAGSAALTLMFLAMLMFRLGTERAGGQDRCGGPASG
jgi:hypothetical protein